MPRSALRYGERHYNQRQIPAVLARVWSMYLAGHGTSAIGRAIKRSHGGASYHLRELGKKWTMRNLLVHNGAGL